MQFNILGPLEIRACNGAAITLQAPKVRQLVGMLLLVSNQVVSTDRLIDELWGSEPPASASTTLQTYVYAARKALAREVGTDASRSVLVTRSPGYAMVVGTDTDFSAFCSRASRAQQLMGSGDLEAAVVALDDALSLWRGSVLADVDGGALLRAHSASIEEARLAAVEWRVDAMMRLGRHRELLPDLRALVVAHPYHEWLHEQLVLALSRCGRRAEALQTVRELRLMLSEDLGLELGEGIQRLQHEVLNGDVFHGTEMDEARRSVA